MNIHHITSDSPQVTTSTCIQFKKSVQTLLSQLVAWAARFFRKLGQSGAKRPTKKLDPARVKSQKSLKSQLRRKVGKCKRRIFGRDRAAEKRLRQRVANRNSNSTLRRA